MSDSSIEPALECFRSYVALLAYWHWNSRLRTKLSPSDIVQNTMLRAIQGFGEYRGRTKLEMRAWLRQILLRELTDQARKFDRGKRDLTRERSMEAEVANSAVQLESWLCDPGSSPSEQAQRNEDLMSLADGLAALPDAQQQAVVLHHLHGLSVTEVAEAMGRTPAAVGGLLKRGLAQLRHQLSVQDSHYE